jgi:hypothetical protein
MVEPDHVWQLAGFAVVLNRPLGWGFAGIVVYKVVYKRLESRCGNT